MRRYILPTLGMILIFAVGVGFWRSTSPKEAPAHRPDTAEYGNAEPSIATNIVTQSADNDARTEIGVVSVSSSLDDAVGGKQAPTTSTSNPGPLNPNVLKQIQALETAKLARTPGQKKMDSALVNADRMRRGQPVAEGVATLRIELDRDSTGRVLTDIDADVSNELLEHILEIGGEVVSHFAQFNAIRARLPLAQMEALAERTDVKFIRPAVGAFTNVGSVTSEGDAAHGTPAARAQFNVTGAGVKVAVLSDSVDHMAAAQASGDLGTVTVLQGQAGTGSGEGTAMLEIVHDLAPGSDLFFATGFGGGGFLCSKYSRSPVSKSVRHHY